MTVLDLNAWVAEERDAQRRQFRQAVQLVLRAIAQSPALSSVMVMKGGILLAIRYRSSRFTRDVDFSTPRRLQDVDLSAFLSDLQDALRLVSDANDYGIELRVQSHAVKPANNPAVSFPTLSVRVGYADRRQVRQIERLRANQSPMTVPLDYSFNEWISESETVSLDDGALRMYPFHDLIAEKYRSVLQQPIRQRARYQDIYDLFLLLTEGRAFTDVDRFVILRKLHEASADRAVPVLASGLDDPAVVEWSRKGYEQELPQLVGGPVPRFEEAFCAVRQFFEALPWDKVT